MVSATAILIVIFAVINLLSFNFTDKWCYSDPTNITSLAVD